MPWQQVDGGDDWEASEFVTDEEAKPHYDPTLCGPEYRMWLGEWERELAEYHGLAKVMKALGAQYHSPPPEG